MQKREGEAWVREDEKRRGERTREKERGRGAEDGIREREREK